jgi:F420-dependent oxidoreductase-like protein
VVVEPVVVVGAVIVVVVVAEVDVGGAAAGAGGDGFPGPFSTATVTINAMTASTAAAINQCRRGDAMVTSRPGGSTSAASSSTEPVARPHIEQYRASSWSGDPQFGHGDAGRLTGVTVAAAGALAHVHSAAVTRSVPAVAAGATVRLPTACLVVLIGPSGAGKSTWAAEQFRPSHIVSTDALRALVGEGEHDQRAGTDAFALLDDILERRLRRRLVTVIDSLGLDESRRQRWLAAARRHGVPCHAVLFATPPAVCRSRNRERHAPVPAKVLAAQFRAFENAAATVAEEGFDGMHDAGTVEIVSPALVAAPAAAARQRAQPMRLAFGLHVPSFTWPGGPGEIGPRLAAVAAAAEEAGFSSLWVMDHVLQIPFVGREWLDMLDSYTTLGFLAGRTTRIRLGTMVTAITFRNVAHLAKIVATLDVLSGGRAECGLGAAGFEREHRAYGWAFPPLSERYALLEDALRVLPLLWGPGAPSFEGRVVRVAEATCYPRPLQEHIPVLVGGQGERRTLALVARYADACNLRGDAATVRHKLDVLRRHCAAVGRDPATVRATHLSTALVGRDAAEVDHLLISLATRGESPETLRTRTGAGTVDDHIGSFRHLAEAGVTEAIVSLPDLSGPAAVERFAAVIEAFDVGPTSAPSPA